MLSYLLAALESEEDKRRFTELYEENHVRAEQTALRILRDPHDAEDAVQNAFLQVIHALQYVPFEDDIVRICY